MTRTSPVPFLQAAFVLAVLAQAPPAAAQDFTPVTDPHKTDVLVLRNGDRIKGDFRELQRERTYVNYGAGEVRSCTGCHGQATHAAHTVSSATPIASKARLVPMTLTHSRRQDNGASKGSRCLNTNW